MGLAWGASKIKVSLRGEPVQPRGVIMKVIWIAGMACLLTTGALARTTVLKTEVVEEQDKSETKVFCSKNSEQEAANLCEKWLQRQTKSLGERLLTSSCTPGDMSSDTGCLYKATGDLKYVMRKYRTETERD